MTFKIHVDFKKQRVGIVPDPMGTFDLEGAQRAAQRWADHYGFSLSKGAKADDDS